MILDLYADFVMPQAPYQTAAWDFWIVDGGCVHQRTAFLARLRGMYANAERLSDPRADRSTSA